MGTIVATRPLNTHDGSGRMGKDHWKACRIPLYAIAGIGPPRKARNEASRFSDSRGRQVEYKYLTDSTSHPRIIILAKGRDMNV